MCPRPFWPSIVFFYAASAASANIIQYHVSVNTSGISGTSGSVDLQFNPGPLVSQSASLQILNFASNGSLAGAPSLTGDVTGGPLPATLVFDNGTGFNDYFGGFAFGTDLSFDVSLYGPALSSPDGTSTSGSTFAFGMFSDNAGTIPALTTDLIDALAFKIDVNLDGTTTVTNFSPETGVSAVTSVPEPSSFAFVATTIALTGALILFKRRAELTCRISTLLASGKSEY
jgi:hypothetical protein